jgi:hypothetical protein
MFKMFKQLFAAITVFFGATEKIANAFNEIATWTEEEARSFNDKARIERNAMLQELSVKSTANLASTIRGIEREASADIAASGKLVAPASAA